MNMSDENGTQQLTSDYVLSRTNRSIVAAAADSARITRTQPTIRSFDSSELSDIPSDVSTNVPSPTDTSMDDLKVSRPIFKVNALCVQALIYPIIVVIYLLIGAAVFTGIEHPHEGMAKVVAEDEIQKAIQKIAVKMNLTENATEEILNDFTYLCTNNYLQIRNAPYQWGFLPSFYFAATVITAIGYGHASPEARLGRAFLCVYALMGIPLLLVSLVTIGKYFSGVWDAILSRISSKKFLMNKHKDVYSFGIFTVLGLIGVVFIPAAVFQRIESEWSYDDAVYFAIVSLTTVGLGDLTPPLQHLTKLQYIVLYLTWLFIGLAIVSVLVTKMTELYTKVNKSIIVLYKRCFNKCFRMKKNYLLTTEENELDTM